MAANHIPAEYASPTEVRRMIDLARKTAKYPLLGSEIGRLRLNAVINDRQLWAATKYLAVVGRYDEVMGFSRRLSSWGGQESSISARDDDAIIAGLDRNGQDLQQLAKTNEAARTILNAKARHKDAVVCLAAKGAAVLQAVNKCVVEDRHIEVGRRVHLIAGLDALASIFGGH